MPRRLVILAQAIPNPPRLDAHDGIGVGVERIGAVEDLTSDDVALEPVAVTSERLADDVVEEPDPAARLLKRSAIEDAVELLANGGLLGLAPTNETDFPSRQRSRQRRAALPHW